MNFTKKALSTAVATAAVAGLGYTAISSAAITVIHDTTVASLMDAGNTTAATTGMTLASDITMSFAAADLFAGTYIKIDPAPGLKWNTLPPTVLGVGIDLNSDPASIVTVGTGSTATNYLKIPITTTGNASASINVDTGGAGVDRGLISSSASTNTENSQFTVTFNVGGSTSSVNIGDVDIAKRPELSAANLVSTNVIDLIFDVAVSSNKVLSTLINTESNVSVHEESSLFVSSDGVATGGGHAAAGVSPASGNVSSGLGGIVFIQSDSSSNATNATFIDLGSAASGNLSFAGNYSANITYRSANTIRVSLGGKRVGGLSGNNATLPVGDSEMLGYQPTISSGGVVRINPSLLVANALSTTSRQINSNYTGSNVTVNPVGSAITSIAFVTDGGTISNANDPYNRWFNEPDSNESTAAGYESKFTVAATAGATIYIRAVDSAGTTMPAGSYHVSNITSPDLREVVGTGNFTAGARIVQQAASQSYFLVLREGTGQTSMGFGTGVNGTAGTDGAVTTGYMLQASLDNFAEAANIVASTTTVNVDRKQPNISSATAVSGNSLTITVDEDLLAASVTGTGAGNTTEGGGNITVSGAGDIKGVAYSSAATYDSSTDVITLSMNYVSPQSGSVSLAANSTASANTGGGVFDLYGNMGNVSNVTIQVPGTAPTAIALTSSTAYNPFPSSNVTAGHATLNTANNGDTVQVTLTGASSGADMRWYRISDNATGDSLWSTDTITTPNTSKGNVTFTTQETSTSWINTIAWPINNATYDGQQWGIEGSFDNFATKLQSGSVITVDQTRPSISSVEVQGPQAVQITFSEAIDETATRATSQLMNAGNYTLTRSNATGAQPTVSSVAYISGSASTPATPSVVRLTLSTAMTEGNIYTIAIDGDESGVDEIRDLTLNSHAIGVNHNITGPGSDTTAPTATLHAAAVGDTTIVAQLGDDSGAGAVDGTNTSVSLIRVNGNSVGFAETYDAATARKTLTLSSITFASADTYEVTITAQDVSGNKQTYVLSGTVSEVIDIPDTLTVYSGLTGTITPTTGSAASYASADAAVATVDSAGVVTGVAAGTVTVTATDASANTDTTTVTVMAIPAADDRTVATADGLDTDATITSSIRSGTAYTSDFASTDTITLDVTVNVDTADVGQPGEFYLVVDMGGTWIQSDDTGAWSLYDGIANLPAFRTETAMDASETVTVSGTGLSPASYSAYVGYSNKNGTTASERLIYGDAISFTVQ